MLEITESIKSNDVATPIKLLLKDRERNKKKYYSIYRDILFLSINALGRENIDAGTLIK